MLLAWRDHFQRVMKTGMATVSGAIMERTSKLRMVASAGSVKSAEGMVIRCLGAALHLRENGILTSIRRERNLDGAVDMVINASGRILAHSDGARLMGKVEDESGFTESFGQWVAGEYLPCRRHCRPVAGQSHGVNGGFDIGRSEVGQVGRALQHVLVQRQQREQEAQALLHATLCCATWRKRSVPNSSVRHRGPLGQRRVCSAVTPLPTRASHGGG